MKNNKTGYFLVIILIIIAISYDIYGFKVNEFICLV